MLCKWFILTTVALLSAISSITANIYQGSQVDDDDNNNNNGRTIVVNPLGRGGFRSIQAAINSVRSNSKTWTTIDIKPGTYREQVSIPHDKPFIYLKGRRKENTFIVWNASDGIQSPTFISEADNTLAKDITFTNSYNYPLSSISTNPIKAAVAARIQGDKSGFYRCRFLGVQDTLFDAKGRHYFRDCTIEGEIDFIFGGGQSHYQNCTITVNAEHGGFIAAQGRGEADGTSGFVFKGGSIGGRGKVFLGRPWRPYARTLYYKTRMSGVVKPKGWDAWYSRGKEDLLMMSESGCFGPGAKRSERVKWEKKLSVRELKHFINISFIDKEGWVKKALQIWAKGA